ncbi:MAG: hypothetical protein K5673_09300 [Lachnospiraceae bacterium]|nr:hypothetical protein [Lachnospiraceae bacterium]
MRMAAAAASFAVTAQPLSVCAQESDAPDGSASLYEPVEVVMTPNECLTLGDEAPELKLLIESDGTVTFIVSDYSYAEAGLTAVLLPDEHGGLVAGHNAYSVPDGKSYNYAQTGFTIQGRITEAYHNQLMDKGSDGTARMCSFFEGEFYDEPTYVFEKSQTTIGKGMTEDGDYYTIGTIVYDTPEGFFFKLFYWPDTGEYRLEYSYRYTWTGQTRQYREANIALGVDPVSVYPDGTDQDFIESGYDIFYSKYSAESPYLEDRKIHQEVVTPADPDGGETEVIVDPGIIDPGIDPPDTDEPGDLSKIIGIGAVGAVVAGGAVTIRNRRRRKKSEKDSEEDEQQDESEYKMVIYKDFGDTLTKGEGPRYVYARITETKKISGATHPRDDLTQMIRCYSADQSLIVQDAGITTNGVDYKTARIEVPDDFFGTQADLTFSFTGRGGSFVQHVVFNVMTPMIIFAQENLGLPANRLQYALPDDGDKDKDKAGPSGDREYRLPFLVYGMPAGSVKVGARLEFDYSTDASGRVVEGALDHKTGIPYSIEVVREEQSAGTPSGNPGDGLGAAHNRVYSVVFRETADYERTPGTSEGFKMWITAEYGDEGSVGHIKIEQPFPVFRIHLGVVFTMESNSIPCYMQVKPGLEKRSLRKMRTTPKPSATASTDDGSGKATAVDVTETGGSATLEMLDAINDDPDKAIRGEDTEPVFSEGSIMVFMYRKKDMSIVRVPGIPYEDVKLTVKKLENSRWCRINDMNENHQKLVDSLAVKVLSTGRVTSSGAHIVKFCSTKAGLDSPTRMICEMEMEFECGGKTFTVKRDVLLRSQPFRTPKDTSEDLKFNYEDGRIAERLLHIQSQIYKYALGNLASVYDLIGRMVEGYDPRFGYDATQVANVIRMWVGWINKTYAGANGTPEGVTLSDEIAAGYAFLQGLRDNTGILGRIAMGVMTAGYSEYVFTTMSLAEEMRQKVFECRGDEEFGFWDAVKMGSAEFGKQILLEVALSGINVEKGSALSKITGEIKVPGIAQIGGEYLLKVHNIDMAGTMKMWAGRYRSAMDTADVWLKSKSSLYRIGDDVLTTGKNFFNSSAKELKAGIEENTAKSKKAASKAEEALKKARENMNAEELAGKQEYGQAMEDAMEEVRSLQQAQQDMEAVAGDPVKLKDAKANYRLKADIVMTDKNALKILNRTNHPYAQRMRAQFNRYRETLFDEVQREALADVAKEIGRPVDELYIMNVSNGANMDYVTGKKVPADRDISYCQKVLSDPSGKLDLTIDQTIGERAVARRLYKKMMGKEADTIEEALKFMKDKDVTYVNPNYDAGNYVFEHNLNGYEDLAGMVGLTRDANGKLVMDKSLLDGDLHNKVINQKSVFYKGVEWFETDAKASLKEAIKYEQKALTLTGAAKTEALTLARKYRNAFYGQTVEGVRQITKQVEKIINIRSMKRTGMKLADMYPEIMELHELALRVGDDVDPIEFIHVLREDYGLDLIGYADLMSHLLD